MDRLRTMQSFVEVAAAGSFAAAAEKLGASRALITKHVVDLENRLGARLFHRTTRKISLTDAGEKYYEFCRGFLSDLERQDAEISQTRVAPHGPIRIIAPKSFGGIHLSTAIADFAVAHPDINVTLILDDSFTRSFDFANEGFDVAIRLSALPEKSYIVARKIAALRWVVCAAPSFLKNNPEPRTVDELADARCLVHIRLSPDRIWRFPGAGRKSSVKVSGVFHSNSVLSIRRAAIAGLGIAMLPTYYISQDLRNGTLKRIMRHMPTIERPVYILFAHNRHTPKKVRLLVNYLAAWFKERPWDKNLDKLLD